MYDLAIIGGGPGGYVAAGRAGAKGLKTVLFEKAELGGVCLNEGCIPTKTLLYSAKVYDTARNGEKYGVSAQQVSFDLPKMLTRRDRVVRRLVAGVGASVKAHGAEVVKGEAMILGKDAGGIRITCAGTGYTAANLLICTGSEAFIPPIEGIADAGVLTHRDLLTLKEVPASLVVIGGGVIGMEFASLYNSLGARVTVVEMMPEILGGGIDSEIAAMLREQYAKKGIVFNLNCKVTRVDNGKVTFTDPEGAVQTIESEKIAVTVGRRAILKGYGLENLDVQIERGGIKTDEGMRTSVAGVYAAGDVTGFSMLAHTASREGEIAVDNIAGLDIRINYDAVPGVVYTSPEVASVGLTLRAAADRGLACREVNLPMAYAGRFVAENEMGVGLCKVVAEEGTGRVVGVHMIGSPASEMIAGCCLIIEHGMTVHDLEKTIFPHPTVSEIIRETALTF